MGEVKADYELRVFGLMRSGNHAIITWIANQCSKRVHFVNNVKDFLSPKVRWRHDPIYFMDCFVGCPSDDVWSKKKSYLVHSYEDFDITTLTDVMFTRNRQVIGKCGRFRQLLILRDPFNLFASRLRRYAQHGKNI